MNKDEILSVIGSGEAKESSTTFADSGANLRDCGLGNVDCPICGNTGVIITRGKDLLELHTRECDCMKKRRSLRSLKAAGMEDMARRYTMEAYKTDIPLRKTIKDVARRFINQDEGWFFIGGQSGSGKTHICTAICTGLMDRFSYIVFMPWRDDSTILKLAMKEPELYERKIKALKNAPVLYIDDFLKGGTSEADIRLAFEILNSRYNTESLRTIISSEYTLKEILEIDEALGGRIYERARGFTVKAPDENWRKR